MGIIVLIKRYLIEISNKRKISICFFSHSSTFGGAEKILFKLLEGLKENNIDVFVILPRSGPFINDLKSKNIKYRIIPYKLWLNHDKSILRLIKRTIWNFLLVIPFSFIIHRYKFDLIYSNTSTVSLGAYIAKVLRIPHIWHFREFGFEDHGYTYDLGNWLSWRMTNYLSTLCLVNSKAVLNKYSHFIDRDKLHLIYEAYKETNSSNAVSNTFKAIDLLEFKCLMVGSIQRGKGHIDAISSLAILHKKGYNISLLIVGDGDENYKQELELMVRNNQLENHVYFLGHLNNPREIMRISDVFLMCSRNEAFGLVTLEALEVGLPAIGTKSGGTVEIIEDNFTGLLYTPGNYSELASKIEYLFLNPVVKTDMGNKAKATINKKFNPDLYISKTIEMIHKAID